MVVNIGTKIFFEDEIDKMVFSEICQMAPEIKFFFNCDRVSIKTARVSPREDDTITIKGRLLVH